MSTRTTTIALLLREAAVMALGPVLWMLAQYFGWGFALARFAMLMGLAAVVWLCARAPGTLRSALGGRRGAAWLTAAVLALIAGHGSLHLKRFVRDAPCGTDMGKPSVCAVEWVLHGRNPWASCLTEGERHAARNGDDTMAWCARQSPCVDRKRYASWVHGGPGFDFMNGYKYGPVPLLLYGPFTHVLDDGGIRLVNAFGWLALLAAVAALARQAFATVPLAPWRALIVLLAPVALPLADVLPVLTVKRGGHTYATDELGNSVITDALSADCANDVIPMLFAIAAVMLAGRRRAAWAGVCLGLSLASKQLPGALLLLLIPGLPGLARRRFFASLAGTLLLAYLPPLLTGPRELIANLVLFPLMRPTNSSSVHALVSGHVRAWLSALQVAVVAIIVVRFHRAAIRDVRTLLVSATLMTTIFVALNKVVHANYFIWIAPLAAILIAGAFTDHEAAPARRRGSS